MVTNRWVAENWSLTSPFWTDDSANRQYRWFTSSFYFASKYSVFRSLVFNYKLQTNSPFPFHFSLPVDRMSLPGKIWRKERNEVTIYNITYSGSWKYSNICYVKLLRIDSVCCVMRMYILCSYIFFYNICIYTCMYLPPRKSNSKYIYMLIIKLRTNRFCRDICNYRILQRCFAWIL